MLQCNHIVNLEFESLMRAMLAETTTMYPIDESKAYLSDHQDATIYSL